MGAFFTNCSVRTTDAVKCAKVLTAIIGSRALVTNSKNGWITIYDEESESQDINILRHLANTLSTKLETAAIAIIVHDSDVFAYLAYDRGELIDQFDSKPDYFGPVSKAQKKKWRGDFAKLLPYGAKGTTLADFRQAAEKDHVVEEERAGAFAKLLGIDPSRAMTGFKYVQETKHSYRLIRAKGFSRNEASLVEAVSRGDADKVRTLLGQGTNPNQTDRFGEPLLVVAGRRKNFEISRDLIAHGANLFAEVRGGGDALWMAADEGQENIVALILEKAQGHPKFSASVQRAFAAAVSRGRAETMKLLIRAGADINAKTSWGQPALAIASIRGLEFIWETKVGKRYPQRRGEAKTDWKQAVMVLLDAGAQIPFPSKDGPIDVKALSTEQKSKLADKLLEAGSKIKLPERI